MKKLTEAQKNTVQEECIEYIKSIGAKPEISYQGSLKAFKLNTSIGECNIIVDANCKSKVQSLFVRFLDTKKAKVLFGHWKVNLHETESLNFLMSVKLHIESIQEKTA